MDVEPQDQLSTWLADIDMVQSRSRITTARAIAAYMLKVFPDRADVWEKAIEIEEESGERYRLHCSNQSLSFILFIALRRMNSWNKPSRGVPVRKPFG
jgi:hypothetical protein